VLLTNQAMRRVPDIMRLINIEGWTISVAERLKRGEPIEDARVEVKSKWLDPIQEQHGVLLRMLIRLEGNHSFGLLELMMRTARWSALTKKSLVPSGLRCNPSLMSYRPQ
jgi:hypothetical protein